MEYVILIVALAGIVFGADWLVDGSVSIARKFKVSDFVIGAAIVGVGTSMPELMVSFLGALQGNSDVAIGNVVGSNIFNVLCILGVTAALFPIAVTKDNLKFEIPCCIAVTLLLTVLSFNFFNTDVSELGHFDGLILLVSFGIFMWYSFYRDKKNSLAAGTTAEYEEETTPVWKSSLKVAVGLGILIFSCDQFVDKAIIVAKSWGVSEAVISITLIACGTSLPELAASIAAAVKKNTQLALGNIIGSNIFNITLILGLSSQVTDLSSPGITIVDYGVAIVASIIPLLFGLKGRINRWQGVVMIAGFICYTMYLFV